MFNYLRILQPLSSCTTSRSVHLCPLLQLKQIEEIQDGNKLTIAAKIIPSERDPYLLKNPHPTICPVCAFGAEIKHTDVLILSQFVRSDGCMLPRRITGLCKTQQKRISTLVTMAHKAGLLSAFKPASYNGDPKRRREWRKFNKYFDETTITVK